MQTCWLCIAPVRCGVRSIDCFALVISALSLLYFLIRKTNKTTEISVCKTMETRYSADTSKSAFHLLEIPSALSVRAVCVNKFKASFPRINWNSFGVADMRLPSIPKQNVHQFNSERLKLFRFYHSFHRESNGLLLIPFNCVLKLKYFWSRLVRRVVCSFSRV